MALTLPVLSRLLQARNAILQLPKLPRRVLALGYPDIVVRLADLDALFGADLMAEVPIRIDSDQVIQWHKATSYADAVLESEAFFNVLGLELEVVDIAPVRGGERIVDLNYPCPSDLHDRYAMVIDGGTCEHCFNIGQAMKNLAEMTAVDGYVLASNPLSMFNHGFYNINPNCYYDFYGQNGFEVISVEYTVQKRPDIVGELPAYNRLHKMPDNAMLIMLAKRAHKQEINWPKQKKYIKFPSLSGNGVETS